MAPGQGGKRKRGERSYSGDSASNEALRPSPHRPSTLNMAYHHGNQSSQPRDQNDMRDRSRRHSNRGGGGRHNSRRGSYEGQQNFSSPQHREPSAMSPPSPTQSREIAETVQPNGETVTTQPNPSLALSTPAAQSQTQHQSHIESDPPVRRPSVPSPPYDYEYVTDTIVQEWSSTGKQKVVEEGTSARVQENLAGLASIYQELIRSAIYGRLSPSEAGTAVKAIIGDNFATENVEMESKEAKASPSVFDPRSLFLDTLSIVTDSDTSNFALKPLVFATSISPALMRLQLDTPLLQSLGLVRETFARMGIRKQTNLLYRQSNYNLLREETEGYSKLLTELFATSGNEPPSSEVVEDTFERVKAMIGAFDMDVGRVLDVTLDVFAAVLVKQFRFFVKLLRVSSWWPKENETTREALHNFGLPNWALPGSTGWITTDEEQAAIMKSNEERDREFWDRVREVGIQAFFEIGHKSIPEEERLQLLAENDNLSEEEAATRTWIQETGTLPPKGNRVAAQLLGFKLRFYASSVRSKDDVLPDTLIYLSALLIKVGFISLRDLYTHLWRPDEMMEELKTEKMTEKAEREKAARPGGGINALMLAGALSDDTVPPQRLREDSRKATPSKDQEADKQSTKTENDLPDPADQKILLLKSLLLLGAVPEALFIISKFPWLMDGFPELPDFIHRILHHSLSKVYSPLRPLSGKDLTGQRQILSNDQSGLPKGQIRLAQPSAKRTLRWAKIDTDDENEGIAYRFYWDEWSNNIPVCQSVDDVFALCSSFLNLSGHKIGQDASLLSKLARIGKDSLSKDTSEENKTRWRDLCKRLLLPSVSLTKANPGVVNEVFDLLSFFPREVRYNMYAEWYSGQTSRLPDIKSAFDQARAETKDVLKRLSKTNTRPMARALAKIAYANPGIVINVAISQIESYENLIEVVVECARYFTNLGYDILTWSLINSLGQKGRSRVQEGGLLTSRWLNALSTFAGRAFKRYSIMDPTPLLQYVVEQLRHNNSTDLIVLEQMIVSMAGIITDNNFNDAQVQAMAGGEILKAQTILQLLDKRHESKTTSKRLIKSLTHTRLAGQLLVAIAQERLTCVYNEPSSELKLLGNIFDEIHRILTQYLDLLRSNLSVEEFDSFVPDFAALVKDFGVQPEIAFWIRRASISKKIAESEASKMETESTTKEITETPPQPSDGNQMDTTDDGNGTPKVDQTTAEREMNNDKEEVTAAPLSSNPVMQDLINNVKTALPAETWEVIGPHFYATFWQLDLYDVHVPGQSYDEEMGRLKKRIMTISNDRSDLSLAGSQRKDRDRKAITDLRDRLLQENRNHLTAYSQTRSRLLKEKDQWFAGMRLKHDALNIALLEQCFLPRLLLSPLDAFFCFKLLKFLHSSGTPNFRTVGLLDQLFREQRLTALIFLCTSKEADNLGRFLNEVLRDLSRWHADKAVYEREAFGTKKDLPGFAKNVGPEGVPLAFLEFEDFRRLLYKWHRLFSVALKTCLNSGEYMHIRNAISVLKAVVQHFPAVNWIGRDMLNCVNALSKNDERDDVKIPAASLIGDLNRREKKWMLPQAFNMVKTGAGNQPPTDGKSGTPQPGSGTPNSLNASAPEFKPTSGQPGDGSASQEGSGKMEVEDGEIEDAKMADAASLKGLEDAKAAEPGTDSGTSTAMDLGNDERPDIRGQLEPPVRPRPGSRASDSARPSDIPRRPDPERSTSRRQQPGRPPHSDGRLPPRPEMKVDDRRDRLSDFNPRTRHANPDSRSFDTPNVRDRFGMRPLPDDPMRGPPYRDSRLPREPDWNNDRPGRLRPDPFHARDGPARDDLMPDFADRPGDGPRRGEPMRPDRPPRPLSPPRSDLPNRPDRRGANFTQLPPRDEFPRGPRDRAADPRDAGPGPGPDLSHGRLRQPDAQSEIPSGPRGSRNQRGRNASGRPSNGKAPTPERQVPTGPARQGGRGGPEQSPAPPSDASVALGIHPDRVRNIVDDTPSQQSPPAAMTPPSGPRGGANQQQTPRGPAGDRNRSDKRFAGINNMLQQTNPAERSNATPPARGRGGNRQSDAGDLSSPQISNRPPTGPASSQDDGQRNRPARGGDLLEDTGPDNRRSGGRDRNREKDRERERRGEENANGGGGNRREERRNRDPDRERGRRSDVGGGAGRDKEDRDKERQGESRESLRRTNSLREETRRRDRRDRDEGPPDASGPPSGNANDEGRLRPPSSVGAPPPPPPPPPPPLPNDEQGTPRRWGSGGGDRGNRNENRDRERERRGDRGRDREHRDSGGSGGHRKRGRPNPEEMSGDGNPRGPRMGNDNKRPRRGA
ncbi:hypothetical protein N7523_008682 [Penicillium sp. IBT 18751x]|nr:hypothetical protein N7523_008682 [Penicillium sp. IBT 18751x]